MQDSEHTLISLQRKACSFRSLSPFESFRQTMVRGQIFAMACISVLAPRFGLRLSWVLLFTDVFQPLGAQPKLRHESHFNILDHSLGSISEFSGSNCNCEWNLLGGGVSPPILGFSSKLPLCPGTSRIWATMVPGMKGACLPSRRSTHSAALLLWSFGKISVTCDGTYWTPTGNLHHYLASNKLLV